MTNINKIIALFACFMQFSNCEKLICSERFIGYMEAAAQSLKLRHFVGAGAAALPFMLSPTSTGSQGMRNGVKAGLVGMILLLYANGQQYFKDSPMPTCESMMWLLQVRYHFFALAILNCIGYHNMVKNPEEKLDEKCFISSRKLAIVGVGMTSFGIASYAWGLISKISIMYWFDACI